MIVRLKLAAVSAMLVVLAWEVQPAAGQVNTERMRIAEDVDGFAGQLEGQLVLNKGNVDVLQVVAGGRLDFAFRPHLIFLVGNIRYGERTGAAFQNAGFTHLRYNYRYKTWLTHEVFTQLEYNQFTLLERRTLLGTGLRFRIYRAVEQAASYYGTSYMLEDEVRNLERIGLPREHTTVHRWSNFLVVQLQVNERVTFSNTVYLQPRLDDIGDIRVLDEAAVTVDLTARTALRTTFTLRYDSRPPPTIEGLDIAITNGVSFRF